uniref:Transmembrane protein 59 like n=1 Tax=Ornithorhynchus anatinus TaxID=9258 RepID=A0A6I8NC39_ORNAN
MKGWEEGGGGVARRDPAPSAPRRPLSCAPLPPALPRGVRRTLAAHPPPLSSDFGRAKAATEGLGGDTCPSKNDSGALGQLGPAPATRNRNRRGAGSGHEERAGGRGPPFSPLGRPGQGWVRVRLGGWREGARGEGRVSRAESSPRAWGKRGGRRTSPSTRLCPFICPRRLPFFPPFCSLLSIAAPPAAPPRLPCSVPVTSRPPPPPPRAPRCGFCPGCGGCRGPRGLRLLPHPPAPRPPPHPLHHDGRRGVAAAAAAAAAAALGIGVPRRLGPFRPAAGRHPLLPRPVPESRPAPGCRAACSEAYGQAEEQLACIEGCRRQMPEMESQEEKIPEPPPAALSVLDLFSNLCSDLVSSAQSFLSSTWTYYLQADDGKVVVFQSQPVMESLMLKTPQPKQMEAVWLGSDPDNLDSHSDPGEKLEKPARKEAKGKARLQTSEPPQPADFLGCMSKRSGLPRWILAVCLFFSVLVMLWLSCASLVTAPDQHIRTQPLSIAGDKDYLEKLEHPLALPPVLAIAVCPAESDPEAGPLPLKVELDRTAL